MPALHSRSTASALVLLLTLLCTTDLSGQACQGTPGRSVWLERGTLLLGNTMGGGLSLGGSRFGLAAAYRYRDVSDAISGHEARIRAALVFRASRIQLCPVLSLGAQRDEWQVDAATSVTSTTAAGTAGLGVGVELPIVANLSLIPHVIGQYEYSATYFEIAGGTDNDESAAWFGRGDVEFGMLARFRFLYGGYHAHWDPRSDYGYHARWILGARF